MDSGSKHSPADIAPLIAVIAAVGALLNDEPDFESAYAGPIMT